MSKPPILIVEDDPILRDMTRRQLEKLGFESISVASGEEAIKQDTSQVSLIFMDIGLPGIDGTHATMLIRERELREQQKRVPIVALTGHADKKRALSVGMDDFLMKPALMADLQKVLDRWLAGKTEPNAG